MYKGHRVLAIVPARSGSGGLKHKNIRPLHKIPLLGRCGAILSRLPWVDLALLSTDSKKYVEIGKKYGLRSLGLRPGSLSGSTAKVMDTVRFELLRAEKDTGARFDIVLLIEPSSPLRTPQDIKLCVDRLLRAKAQTALTISELPIKFHPKKIFQAQGDRVEFFDKSEATIVNRQEISDKYYWRNGICYALMRDSIFREAAFITSDTTFVVTKHQVANIDDELDFAWADLIFDREKR